MNIRLVFLLLAWLYSTQGNAQQNQFTQNRFGEHVNQVVKDPSSLAGIENMLSGMLREHNDYNELRKVILVEMQQETSNIELQELFSWTFIHEKKFEAAFFQESALDKRLKEDGRRLMDLGQICLSNQSWDLAEKCFHFVLSKGKGSRFYELARKQILECFIGKISSGIETVPEIEKILEGFKSYLRDYPNSTNQAEVLYKMALIYGHFLDQPITAVKLLEQAQTFSQKNPYLEAECKLELGDIFLVTGKIWDAALLYGQVAKTFGEDPLGQEARFRSARIYYFTGDFLLAKSQLDVLKTATSELVSNDALKLSLIIQENTVRDSAAPALKMFARSELLLYRNKGIQALKVMDSIRLMFPGSSLEPEILLAEANQYLHENKPIPAIGKLEMIAKYPGSVRSDDALFLLATVKDQKLKDKDAALILYNKLIRQYPGSFYVPEARKNIRVLRGEEIPF